MGGNTGSRRGVLGRIFNVLSCKHGAYAFVGVGVGSRGCGLHLLQARPVRRSLMPKLWLPKPETQPPMCSPGFRTCARMWNDGRASWGACEARTLARWSVMQAIQVSEWSLPSWGPRYGRRVSQPVFSAVSTLEKTLPQLLAKLSRLENRVVHNASLALSANIGRVRKLIAQARGAANKVGNPSP